MTLDVSLKKNGTITNIHSGIPLSCHRNKIIKFAGKGVELAITMLSKVTQFERDKYLMFTLVCRTQLFKFVFM